MAIRQEPTPGTPASPIAGGLPAETILVPVTDENDVTKIYAINTETGDMARS